MIWPGRIQWVTASAALLLTGGSPDVTFRESVAADGSQGNEASRFARVSPSGRMVGFSSQASNLVPGDTNGRHDAFVCDLVTGAIQRVSLSTAGQQSNGWSSHLDRISANDRFAVFSSDASNLVEGDMNGGHDVFVRDLSLQTTERASLGNGGVEGNDRSFFGSVSADGRYVAFASTSTNLVQGDTNGWDDVFVYDRWIKTTRRVSVSSTGEQGNLWSSRPTITPDGRFVCFSSTASNLVPGDTNRTEDVFVHDTWTGITERVSVASDGTQGNGPSGGEQSITPDGRFVAFYSTASNLVPNDTNRVGDIFVRDRWLGTTTRVSVRSDGGQGNHGGGFCDISDDGRFVAFSSPSTNLVDEPDVNGTEPDVFMHDMWTRETWRISHSTSGEQGDRGSGIPSMSGNGRIVAFESGATNLVPNDTNGYTDIFVRVNWSLPR